MPRSKMIRWPLQVSSKQTASLEMSGLISAALLFFTATANADELSNLVQKYVVWRGGAAFERLQSVYMRGSLETAGLLGTEALWVDRMGRQRVDSDLGVLKQTQVVTTGQAWDTTASGQIETMAKSDMQSLSRDEALQLPDALSGRGDAKTMLMSSQTFNGRNWAVERVTFGDQDTYDALIDPQTGELGGFRIVEDRQARFESFSDWRIVDGVRMPFVQTVKTEAPGGDQTVRVITMKLNLPIPPERLARPAPIRRSSFERGTNTTGWIDFEFYQGNRIFFTAKINGHEAGVLLDSGATVSAMDRAFSSKLGLAPKGGFTAPGTGGIDTTGFVGDVDVQIGNLTIKHINAAALDLMPIANRIGHAMPFVLGDEVFNELAVEIDFAHHRLAFRDLDSFIAPGGAMVVPLNRIFGNRSVPVSVEGAAAVPFEFDLGNGGPLDVYPAYYEAHSLRKGRQTSQIFGGGVGGFHAETILLLRRFQFAGVDFRDVPATLAADTLSGSNSNVVLGNIGLSILARFRIVTDYAHDRLYATPYADAGTAPFDRDRLGMSLTKVGDKIEVEFVSPGSPAQTAGMRAGEKIISIDGKPATEWSSAALGALRYGHTGDMLEVTVSTAGARKLLLADFF